jgi:hypothetical protein
MALLFRLPFLLLEMLLRRVFGDDDGATRVTPVVTDEQARAAATPSPVPGPPAYTGATGNGAPPPSADEAIERRRDREATQQAAPDPSPPTPLRPIGGAGGDGHVDSEPTVVESFGAPDEVGGTITVDAPWPGYDDDSASSIVTRIKDADPATKGVVALYEQTHKQRKTVLKAAR